MARREKIPLLTVAGLILGAKQAYDSITGAAEENRTDVAIAVLTGYATPKLQALDGRPAFDINRIVPTYGPMVAGKLASDYIGGKKGLNINSKLRAIPMFKL